LIVNSSQDFFTSKSFFDNKSIKCVKYIHHVQIAIGFSIGHFIFHVKANLNAVDISSFPSHKNSLVTHIEILVGVHHKLHKLSLSNFFSFFKTSHIFFNLLLGILIAISLSAIFQFLRNSINSQKVKFNIFPPFHFTVIFLSQNLFIRSSCIHFKPSEACFSFSLVNLDLFHSTLFFALVFHSLSVASFLFLFTFSFSLPFPLLPLLTSNETLSHFFLIKTLLVAYPISL